MSLPYEAVIAYVILIPIILFNVFILFGSLFQKRFSGFFKKFFKVEENNKESKVKILNIINTIIWILIGFLSVLSLENPISINVIFIFLAFRSGMTLIRRFIFGIHDIKIMKSRFSDNRITKSISLTIKISIFFESAFLLSWGIAYNYISISVKSNFGIEVNLLVIILWAIGIIYGFIFSVILGHYSKDFLLKNEFSIALLLTGELFREKINEKIKKSYSKVQSNVNKLKDT